MIRRPPRSTRTDTLFPYTTLYRSARQIAKWGLIGGAGLLAVVALGLALGFGWLQSDSGRNWLARQIEDAASTPGEMELSIGALTGDLPQSLVARDIVLSDAGGPWLTIAAQLGRASCRERVCQYV